jgi:hypothetical protein
MAAISLYVAYYNLCRVHESLWSTLAEAIGISSHPWSIGELLDTALATAPMGLSKPLPTAAARSRL